MAPRFVVDGPNQCPSCAKALTVEFANGGKHAGHYYLRCFNNYGCRFFHPFPTEVAQQARSNGWVPQTHRKPTSPSRWKHTLSRQKLQQPHRSNSSQCCPGCNVRRSNTSCQNELRCRSCCLALGGCAVSGHSEDRLETPSPSSPAEHPHHAHAESSPTERSHRVHTVSSPDRPVKYRARTSLPSHNIHPPRSTPSPSRLGHHPRRSLPSSRTGHINVITQRDVTRLTPRSRVPTNLALIDMTLEELEADEPQWDLAFSGSLKRRFEPSSTSPPAKKKRVFTSASSPSSTFSSFSLSPPRQSAAQVSDWPSGLTVAEMSAGFTRIFSEDAPFLSPGRRFEMEFGGKWDPLVFYLHYDLWKGMSEADRKIGERSDSQWVTYVQRCELLL